MQGQRLLGHPARVVEVDAGGDASGEIGKRDAEIAVGVLVDESDVLAHGLSQFDSGLPLDAFQRADGQIAARMGNGDAPGLRGVLKVDVASLLGDLLPAVGPQSRKNIPAVHDRICA